MTGESTTSFKLRVASYWAGIVIFLPISMIVAFVCWTVNGWSVRDTYWKFRPRPGDGLRKLREEEKWQYLRTVEAERDALRLSIEKPEALVRRLAKEAISQIDLASLLMAAMPPQKELIEKTQAMIDAMVDAMAERFEARMEEIDKALAGRPLPSVAVAPAVLPSSGATTPATAAARAAAAADVMQQPTRTIDPAFVSSQVVGEDVAAAAMRAMIDPNDAELQRALKRYGDTE